MALSSATITYDIADLVGNDFDARRTKVWVSTNIDSGVISDTVGNQIRVGDGLGTVAEDGTGSVSVWAPGTGSNPTTWQTYVHLDYAERRPGGARVQKTFGPFTVTTSANLADLIEEQEVPPTYLSTVTALLQGYVDDAEAARDQAVTAGAPDVGLFQRRVEPASYTYNSDGTVATETAGGLVTTYAYNSDGTVHTVTRNGVTMTYTYNASGNVTAVA